MFLSKLLSHNANKLARICIVSHGGFINMLFRSFIRLPLDSNISITSGDTGIHLWHVNDKERRIIFNNYQEHIGDI
jgi:2,3-bisphosphoglycerate-dependent phosphoglycerate mutase